MATSKQWYEYFQVNRAIAASKAINFDPLEPTICYALSIRSINYNHLKIDVDYRLHFYFYDKRAKIFFGRPYYTKWKRPENETLSINEVHFFDELSIKKMSALRLTIFFHCPIKDESIVLIIELVENICLYGKNNWSDYFTKAWSASPIYIVGKPTINFRFKDIDMYISRLLLFILIFMLKLIIINVIDWKKRENVLDKMEKSYFTSRYHLYGGSPKQLIFIENANDIAQQLRKIGGTIELCLQTHAKMLNIIDFFPEFNIVGANEIIPGLKSSPKDNGGMQLMNPQIDSYQKYLLFDVVVSFGPHLAKFEEIFMELVNTDRLYRINKSPNDNDVQQMHILERRLRIGIHNGFSYIDEPQCIHLLFTDKQISGSHSLRRRDLSQSCLKNRYLLEINSLFAQNDVSLMKLVNHPCVAVIFGLDYLIGVKANDGTITASQSVILAWAAWCPFFAGYSDQRISVPLAGGNVIEPVPQCSVSPKNEHTERWIKQNDNVHRIHRCEINMPEFSLSRAVWAPILQMSFSPIIDRNEDKPPFVDTTNLTPANVDIELNDVLNINEIIIQFLGLAESSTSTFRSNMPQYVFFTFHFYRFDMITTEKLFVDRPKIDSKNYPFILKRMHNKGDINSQNRNGFTVKLTVGLNYLTGDINDFVLYLLNGRLIIEVWDGESLIPIGQCLLRQGREAVQANIQASISSHILSGAAETNLLLLLRLANIGHPSTNDMNSICNRNSAIIDQRFKYVHRNETDSYKIRAKPLNTIRDTAIEGFMSVQKAELQKRYDELFNNNNKEISQQNDKQSNSSIKRCSFRNYMFHQELEAYKKLRKESKAAKLLKAVFQAITTEYRIYPSFGEVVFFEFCLHNNCHEPTIAVVETTDPWLSFVLDPDTWFFFKRSSGILTPIEKNFIHVIKNNDGTVETQILLNAMETVYVPFIYDTFHLSTTQEKKVDQVKAVFKNKESGEPIAILNLLVMMRMNVVDRSFRFLYEAEAKMLQLMPIYSVPGDYPVKCLRCSDPSVLLSVENNLNGSQEILLSCHADSPNSLRCFYIYLYADKYCFKLLRTWIIYLHSVIRLNISGIQDQSAKILLTFRLDILFWIILYF
ncbi:unnamed protein product [Dracunculus medinensis]|uniref:Uncharacterized protein n=1 Tax=Dracunculus medinensis TaxID=318479 RepID=A0A158Q518_DRAME|nr:unnamed protein product [Dracunculus medinensis]